MAYDDLSALGRTAATIRTPRGTSLRERQRARRGIPLHRPIARQRTEITVYMKQEVHERLMEAAEEKSLPIDDVIAQIIGGVVCRGSIDAALSMWGDFALDERAENFSKPKRNKRDGNVQV